MNTSEVRKYLAAYADGELPEDVRREVEDHLARDPDSREEVERWLLLRKCAQRALQSEPLPAGLRGRLLERLAAQRRPQHYRSRLVLRAATAAAAAIALAVVVWWSQRQYAGQPVASGPLVMVDKVAKIHRYCAIQHHHDPFGLDGQSRASVVAALAERPETRFAVHLPDWSQRGFRLVGVCSCSPTDSGRAVHAYYQRIGLAAGQRPRPQDVVSFLTIERRVELDRCAQVCGPRRGLRHPQRDYSVARAAGNETVLKWDERARSFVACSALERDELLQLVDAVDVAALLPVDATSLWVQAPASCPLLSACAPLFCKHVWHCSVSSGASPWGFD